MAKDEEKLYQLNDCDKWLDDFQMLSETFVRAKKIIRVHDDMNQRIDATNINAHFI